MGIIRAFNNKQKNSTVKTLFNKTKDFTEESYEETLELLLKTLRLEKKTKGNEQKVIECLIKIAKLHYKNIAFSKALESYDEAIKLAERVNNKDKVCEVYNLIGEIYINLSEFEKAAKYYISALVIEEDRKNYEGIAKCISNLGSVYIYKGDYKKGLKKFKKALAISNNIKNEIGIAKALNNCGVAYIELNNYDKAKAYFKRCYEISKKINSTCEVANSLTNMAIIFLEQEKLERALEYLKHALKLEEKMNSVKRIAYIKFRIAEVYFYLEAYDIALKFLHEALSVFEGLNNYINISYCYSLCADIYEKTLNYKETIRYLKLYMSIKEKLLDIENNRLLAEMEVKYNLCKKEKETELYKMKNDELEEVNKKLKVAYKEVESLSKKDHLTNLSNRRDIIEFIEETVSNDKRSCTVILGDIDNFKLINDELGHDMGDFILVETAKIMNNTINEIGRTSRWGGEEFLMVLPDVNIFKTKEIAESVRKNIENTVYNYDNRSIKITMTFGISECNRKEDIDRVIKKADEAMYIGKNKGKNCVILNHESNIVLL